MEEEEKLLRLEEVCVRLNIGIWTVRKMITDGTLSAHKLGGQWRITESEVERVREEMSKK